MVKKVHKRLTERKRRSKDARQLDLIDEYSFFVSSGDLEIGRPSVKENKDRPEAEEESFNRDQSKRFFLPD